MKYIVFGIIALSMMFWLNPAYGTVSTYHIVIDENSFNIDYEIDANVIAIAVDQELNSLLIGIEDTKDSVFQIELPTEMISAENNEFAVLVDGYEVDYQIISNDSSNLISFFVPGNSQELEIIGTYVIPEFPLGITIVFAMMISLGVFISKKNTIRIRL
ncbi:MAG: hypothetical protein ACE5RJ_02215 [Nitrosopumilaceae archaeon]